MCYKKSLGQKNWEIDLFCLPMYEGCKVGPQTTQRPWCLEEKSVKSKVTGIPPCSEKQSTELETSPSQLWEETMLSNH